MEIQVLNLSILLVYQLKINHFSHRQNSILREQYGKQYRTENIAYREAAAMYQRSSYTIGLLKPRISDWNVGISDLNDLKRGLKTISGGI